MASRPLPTPRGFHSLATFQKQWSDPWNPIWDPWQRRLTPFTTQNWGFHSIRFFASSCKAGHSLRKRCAGCKVTGRPASGRRVQLRSSDKKSKTAWQRKQGPGHGRLLESVCFCNVMRWDPVSLACKQATLATQK